MRRIFVGSLRAQLWERMELLRVPQSKVNILVAWRMGPPTEVTLAQSLYWLFLGAGLACERT